MKTNRKNIDNFQTKVLCEGNKIQPIQKNIKHECPQIISILF